MNKEEFNHCINRFRAAGFKIKNLNDWYSGYINLGYLMWIEFLAHDNEPYYISVTVNDGDTKHIEDATVESVSQVDFIIDTFKLNKNPN